MIVNEQTPASRSEVTLPQSMSANRDEYEQTMKDYKGGALRSSAGYRVLDIDQARAIADSMKRRKRQDALGRLLNNV